MAKFLLPSDMHCHSQQYEDPPQFYQLHHSSIHERAVDLHKFFKFLQKRCKTLEEIRNSSAVSSFKHEIQYIGENTYKYGADFIDMWSQNIPNSIRKFRDWYLEAYSALPSNTHLAESTIKDANFCQISGRSEALASNISTARSGAVHYINSKANHISKRKYDSHSRYKSLAALEFFGIQQK